MKYVVNKDNFTGNAKTVIGENGRCPYYGKTEAEYIAKGYAVMEEDEFFALMREWEDNLCGDWKEITAEQYEDALNILPPVAWRDGGFFMSERYTGNISSFYQQINGKYFSSLQRMSTPRAEIIKTLRDYIKEMKFLFENVSEEKQNMSIDELWIAACSGDIETLREYYSNGGKENRRYNKFNTNHSLIAGAYRNNQYKTVKYLYSVGEVPEAHEQEEIPFSAMVSYNIIITRKGGMVENLGFISSENAEAVFQCICKIGDSRAENIASVKYQVMGETLRQKVYHFND